MLHRWCRQSVTVIRAPEKVERGSVVRDWENAREHTVKGCSVQPTDSTRDFAKREEQSTFRFHMFAPPKADIRRGDRIRCDVGGEVLTFELDGVPYQRFSPTGRVDSTQCDLIVWEGWHMATKIRFEMNHDGWREILCSQKMADACKTAGERIAAEAGEHFGYRAASFNAWGGRVGGYVSSTSIEGDKLEATDKVLTKAVHA